ncbi:right-handed parallel beta-helix repeat-containing protein [Streptomyces sp. NBC_01320]|uniref:right-handed parallel beta-helix repeat-containing protein n=1 Tax=Streptomyces sp. NBC_01320 TaxID=2903824 RepID=UPI002E112F58|nr:right-handed parallel beta-helix repeat-containing protein [Streptomyces sp. NBC_01320]
MSTHAPRIHVRERLEPFDGKAPARRSPPCRPRRSAGAVLTAGGGYGLRLNGASHWTAQGVTVTDGQKGIVADADDDVVIDSVTVHDLDMEGEHFRTSSANGVTRNSRIHETGRDGRGMGEGVSDLTGSTGDKQIAFNVTSYSASCPSTVHSSNTVIDGRGLTNITVTP